MKTSIFFFLFIYHYVVPNAVEYIDKKWIIVFTPDNTWLANGTGGCGCQVSLIFPLKLSPYEDTLMQLVVILSKRTDVKNQ